MPPKPFVLALAFTLLVQVSAKAEPKGPLVFAAASMKTALDAIAAKYAASGHSALVISYGSSGTLAKQIENGAPADLFISADEKWMDVLQKANAIDPKTREAVLGNGLVLVEPADARTSLTIAKGFDLADALGDGKLAVCSVTSCPAGIYGKEALQNLGVYTAVEPKLAQADNVRAALLLVARGEAKFGIVYATDAKAEPKVRVVGTFPESSHTPIVYPVAVTTAAKNGAPAAVGFEAYLHSPEARAILTGQGFTLLAK